jgi:hypothetical protein
MIERNVSRKKENFAQRNNEVNPLISCNTTSMTMATSYIPELWEMFLNSPINEKYKKFSQPEDRLHTYIRDRGLNPENHYDLMKGYNEFMGKEIDHFSTCVPFRFLIDELLAGRPWVGSGTFPGFPIPAKQPLGHIVCVVGMVYESDPYKPAEMIIDDPYGNTINNWQGSGNDIKIPWDLFVNWMKPVKDAEIFWAHRFNVF